MKRFVSLVATCLLASHASFSHAQSNYTQSLMQSSEKTARKVDDWVIKSTGNPMIPMKFHFMMHNPNVTSAQGECSKAEFDKDLKVLRKILEKPQDAVKEVEKSSKLAWFPTGECATSHANITSVSGGKLFGMEVMCGSEVILKGGMKSGGEMFPNGTFLGGGVIGIEAFDGEFEILGKMIHAGQINVNKITLSTPVASVIPLLQETMAACAANQTLLVRGGGGEGWKTGYMENGTAQMEYGGYGFAFEIGYESPTPAPTQAPTEQPVLPPSTQAPATETQAPAIETQAPAPETQAPAPETQAPAPETQAPAPETHAPTQASPTTTAPTTGPMELGTEFYTLRMTTDSHSIRSRANDIVQSFYSAAHQCEHTDEAACLIQNAQLNFGYQPLDTQYNIQHFDETKESINFLPWLLVGCVVAGVALVAIRGQKRRGGYESLPLVG